ncbi:lysophospholipid acyltransferase family protein [Gemmatimonas aurantiaca]|nr:lysophospholipid acyltransferase family protein [Gemmatimonas aurantiaca]
MKKLIHILMYGLLRAIVYFAKSLDNQEAYDYGAAVGRFAMRRFKSRIRVTEDNLRKAFPEWSEDKVRVTRVGVFENIGRTIFEVARCQGLEHDEIDRLLHKFDGAEYVEEVAKRGKGCLFATPHFGNWELIGFWLPANGYKTNFLAGRQTNPYIDKMLNDNRRSVGVNIIPTGSSARQVIRVLRRGEFLGIVPDQHSAIGHEVVEFFGRKVAAHRGTALFAYRTGAAILPTFIIRKGPGHHEGLVDPPIYADTSRPEKEETQRLTQLIMSRFEEMIREYPELWMWTHKRWKPIPTSLSKSEG